MSEIAAKQEGEFSLKGKKKTKPKNLGKANEKGIIYRCNNSKCNAKFDEHGYSVFDSKTQTWERITEG